jgi:hypothetical protein
MMCNQCDDVRRIHGEQIVWIVMKDRKPQMQFKSRHQAERAINLLEKTDPDAFWQIVRDSSKATRWDG